MNRVTYFNYIEEKLNILDFHGHSENFYPHFFNKLFGFNLRNLNPIKQNVAGIDLIDEQNKIIIQVSSTGTKTKIKNSLKKDLSSYCKYNFKFICLCDLAKDINAIILII